MRIIPRKFFKTLFWSTVISLIVFGLLGKGSLGSQIVMSIMTMIVLVIIWAVVKLYDGIKNRLAESKLKAGFTRYKYKKSDHELFDKKVGSFRLIFKTLAHGWRMAKSNDEIEHVVRSTKELLIQYPVNPNLTEGDHYHIQALSIDRLINNDKSRVIIQGYCHEMKRIYNFEIDKIQQAFDFPSGLPVDISLLALRK